MKKRYLASVLAAAMSVAVMTPSANIFANGKRTDPTGQQWYEISGGVNAGSAEIYIFDEIGYWGINATDFARDLKAQGDISNIDVHINSPGGNVFDGTAIYNLLKNHKANVTVYIDGLAASMASVIAMAGDRIVMPENALMMIHNPWGGAVGDADELRKMADVLDKIKSSLMTVYIARTGLSSEEVTALMDAETWYTGAEAMASGFSDEIAPAVDLAASSKWDLNRLGFARTPRQISAKVENSRGVAASPAPKNQQSKGKNMFKKVRDAQGNLVLAEVDENGNILNVIEVLEMAGKDDGSDDVLAAEKSRRTSVRAAFDGFEAHRDLLDTCLDNMECTVEDAQAKLLVALGKQETPTLGTAATSYTDETVSAKYRNDVVDSLSFRAGLIAAPQQNAMMGHTLFELARNALQRNNVSTMGLDKMGIVAAAFTHTSGDFGTLLENVAHKSMMKGYDEAEETFHLWTSKGSLSDFKIASRADLGTFPNLDAIPEGGEYKYATMNDTGETVQLATFGKLFSITRHAIINDDLSAFTRIPQKMGRAAPRTIGNLVYAILNNNPTMADGKALFHAGHNNLITPEAGITTESIAAMSTAMSKHKDGDAFLNIMAKYLLCGVERKHEALKALGSEYAVGGDDNKTTPNTVRNTLEVISDPRLSAMPWFTAADGNMHDTIEVSYLDGVETPHLEQQNGWNIDGVDFKVRLDAGVKALAHQGLNKNAGS